LMIEDCATGRLLLGSGPSPRLFARHPPPAGGHSLNLSLNPLTRNGSAGNHIGWMEVSGVSRLPAVNLKTGKVLVSAVLCYHRPAETAGACATLLRL
jgi:hypothetical protein